MGLMKLVLYGLLLYFAYKLVFDFIIPVSKATRQIKSKIRQAQDQQRRFEEQQQQTQRSQQEPQQRTAEDSEYIDYEEVK